MAPSRASHFGIVAVAVAAASCATYDEPRIRGGRDGFQLTIGIDRANRIGGPNSGEMNRIIEAEARRANLCPEGYSARLASNTAAQYVFVAKCTARATAQ